MMPTMWGRMMCCTFRLSSTFINYIQYCKLTGAGRTHTRGPLSRVHQIHGEGDGTTVQKTQLPFYKLTHAA